MLQRPVLWVWLIALLSGNAWAEPVAMVTDIGGSVSIYENGKPGKVELLSYLESGMTLQLGSNAHLSVTFLSQNMEYRFSGPSRLIVEKDRMLSENGKVETHVVPLQKISAAKKFTVAQREHVTQAAFEMRAGGRGLRLDDPVDTSLIDGGAPDFSWAGPQPDGGYQLSLYDSHNKLLHRVTLASNSWTPPAGLLQAGNAYEWEVRAALTNGEVLTARGNFSVSDNDTATAVRAQSPRPDASFSERVLYAVFLEGLGFKYEARRIWRELAIDRPDDPVLKEHSSR